jgi:4-hydroxy-tetrahydrodipicolinate reductase
MKIQKIKLGVSGACGRMGSRILSMAGKDKVFDVSLALESQGHPEIGEEIAAGLRVTASLELIQDIDVLIDFSSPKATCEHLQEVLRYKKAAVIGTTGFSEAQKTQIVLAARDIPIVFSPNMSIGVNCLFSLVREAAGKLTEDYQARIVEAHHTHKKDAPSGTAKLLGEIVEKERLKQKVEIKAIREGEIIGDHDVIFESPWDTITLKHSAKTRDIFAQGALEAAKFISGKPQGLYGMADVLAGRDN